MFDRIKDKILNMILSREFILILAIFLCGGVLINRLFTLQIVNGASYLENFQLTIRKERSIPATRGNIYDRNGKLLAYNELAYSVTIEDVYESGRTKNRDINETIYKTIRLIEQSGDEVISDFDIYLDSSGNYQYSVSDNALLRFLGDVYGRADINELEYKEKTASPDDVIEYLCSSKRYGIGTYTVNEDGTLTFEPCVGYTKDEILKILTVRYALSSNSYQKYIATTIATDINEKTVAVVSENIQYLDGVSIAEGTIRKYVNSVYFSHIIGYTGKIPSEKLLEYTQKDSTYALNDQVGVAGIEASMEDTLRGQKGSEVIYVDSFGKVIESTDHVEPAAGNDIYLTLDTELQTAAYNILEQKIASIVVSRIENIKEYVPAENAGSSKIKIAIYDVYNALIENSIIDISHFSERDAKETEQNVAEKYKKQQAYVEEKLRDELLVTKTPYDQLSTEYQVYMLYIVSLLGNNNIILTDEIDDTDEVYLAWRQDENIPLEQYLRHCIAERWIDVTKLDIENDYADSEEIYEVLVDYILKKLATDSTFEKRIYRYMIKNDVISGREVCQILCEQKIVEVDSEVEDRLYNGGITAYQFMLDRITNLDITPAQLALEPCSGSMVVTDVNTGDTLALVSYPGYDTNRLANSIDAEYYAKLMNDDARPMYSRATQERTAPGSTYKMVSATAGLSEGVISLSSTITCSGPFDKITPSPHCHIYPGAHGSMNVTSAIQKSCNSYFYEMGYRLGSIGDSYNSERGTDMLAKYADMYGLSETSGLELEESDPKISTEDAVRSSIGQGNNNYTTAQLARYVTTVANSGTCYNLTLIDKITDKNGFLLEERNAEVRNYVEMDNSYWNAIHTGMRRVVEGMSYYAGLGVNVAGKTGTAEQSERHPNHALFVSYAPYENPEISVTVRIANGYSSSYAAQTAKDFYTYYYKLDDEENILTGQADESIRNTAIQGD
ncbi:MAG: penicillin-binding protein [Lachnospiraceae bacterium]|nr:penicillin-binding protein [Lachnospiraceae bacterium]